MAAGLILMRRLLTILTAIVLLVMSLAIGTVAADLPFWRRALQLPLPADALYLPVAVIGETTPPATTTMAPIPKPALEADRALLEATVERARAAGVRVLLAARRGRVVLARYLVADDEQTLLPAGLIARPLVAMAVGRAIADGRIESLDTPVARYLPEWEGEPRGRITVRQLLEDTSGLETGGDIHGVLRRSPWEDPAALPAFATGKGVRMLLGNDFANTALRFQLEHEPGGFHHESPANAQLAALILERATTVPYERYVDEMLWRPLGGGRAELTMDRRAGMPAAHCCWRATAPDILRVVSLLATGGKQEGREILRSDWVREMTSPSRVNPDGGLQLKRVSVGGVPALSGGDDDGNTFWVFPERELAIVSIVNESGANWLDLPASLLRAFADEE
jgi:CubicO group peptidase (beta-lactamase class C family)